MNCPLTGQPCLQNKLFKITEVEKTGYKELAICEDCLQNYLDKQSKPSVPANDLLKTIVDFFGFVLKNPYPTKKAKPASQYLQEIPQPKCPKCNWSLEDIVKTQRVGCHHCYETFVQPLSTVLHQYHGSLKHIGKVPKSFSKEQEEKPAITPSQFIKQANRQLNHAIKDERYEDAAKLRDNIKTVKRLRAKLDRAIKADNYEQAKEITYQLKEIIDDAV